MSLPKEVSEALADLLLATMPREIAPSMVKHMTGVIYAIRDGELKIEDLPENPADLVMAVITVVTEKLVSSKKDDEKKPEQSEQPEQSGDDEVPAELNEVLEKMVDLLAKHNIEKGIIIKRKSGS